MFAAALGIGLTATHQPLALFAVHFAHIDGRTDELSAYLGAVNPNLSLQGIVLAGMIVGALGVLADTAVTHKPQPSWRYATPTQSSHHAGSTTARSA
jgi:uncharacterized membrane protein